MGGLITRSSVRSAGTISHPSDLPRTSLRKPREHVIAALDQLLDGRPTGTNSIGRIVGMSDNWIRTGSGGAICPRCPFYVQLNWPLKSMGTTSEDR
jgi:hypothetical protein